MRPWFEEVRHHKGYMGDGYWSRDPSPNMGCDVMSVFFTAGVDGAHLSAGAEAGNSGQCQVGSCSDCLFRWNKSVISCHSKATLNIVQYGLCCMRCERSSWEKWPIFLCHCFFLTGCPDSVLSDSEDESPEALQILHTPRPLGHYSLCEQGQPDSLLLSTLPPSPRELDRSAVVINQPAPLSLPHQANADTQVHSSDSVRHAVRVIYCHPSVIVCDIENELCLHADKQALQLNMGSGSFDIDIISWKQLGC